MSYYEMTHRIPRHVLLPFAVIAGLFIGAIVTAAVCTCPVLPWNNNVQEWKTGQTHVTARAHDDSTHTYYLRNDGRKDYRITPENTLVYSESRDGLLMNGGSSPGRLVPGGMGATRGGYRQRSCRLAMVV